MATDTTKGTIRVMQEFDQDNIHTGSANGVSWHVTLDNSGTLAPVASAELQAASVTGGADNNMNELAYEYLSWRAQDGFMSAELRVDMTSITLAAVSFGFNDDVLEDSNTLPVELCGTTFTSNAGTFIGFIYDPDATNDNWHAFMVDDCNDTTMAIACLNTGVAPVADTANTLKVVVYDQGACNQTRAEFYIDGKLEVEMASAIDRDILMTPHFGHENRVGCAATANLHYIEVKKSRP